MIIEDHIQWKNELKKSYGDDFKNLIFHDKMNSIGKYCLQPVFEHLGEIKHVKSYQYDDLSKLDDIDVIYCATKARIVDKGIIKETNIIRCIKK